MHVQKTAQNQGQIPNTETAEPWVAARSVAYDKVYKKFSLHKNINKFSLWNDLKVPPCSLSQKYLLIKLNHSSIKICNLNFKIC